MSWCPWHACLPGGGGGCHRQVTQHLPLAVSSLQGTQSPAAKGQPWLGRVRSQQVEGQKPVGVEQQVTKDASESHPHRRSQKGWYGGMREREKQERRWAGRGRKEDTQGERAGTGGNWSQAALHTQEWESSERCWLFQEENRSGPEAVFLPLGAAVSPVSLRTRCYSVCPRPAGRRRSDSHALCLCQAQLLCTAASSPRSPPRHTHSLCLAARLTPPAPANTGCCPQRLPKSPWTFL